MCVDTKSYIRGFVAVLVLAKISCCVCQVWARLPSGLWWPGEMLDPFHLPATRSLPPGAAAGKYFLTPST